MRILFSWLKEFVDVNVSAEELARALTERGIEAETIGKLDALREGFEFAEILALLDEKEGFGVYEIARAGEREKAVSKCKLIPIGLTVLVKKDENEIPTLEELKLSPVRFPLVKPAGMSEKEFFADAVIDFAVVSNRGDLLSHLGIAREVCVATSGELRMPEVLDAQGDGDDKPSITLENVELCPRYVGAYFNVSKICPSPDWLIHRLSLCGVTPISNIVDLSNYVLFELGQPQHTFDRERLIKGIIVRNARKGEKFTAINHVEYTLDESMLVIADKEKAVAIGGVMGGLETEISDATSSVLLESAYFTPENIRVECKRLGLMSESSLRFGRGTDPEMPPFAAKRFLYLAEKIGAGNFVQGSFVDANLYKGRPLGIYFTPQFINSFLGTSYDEENILSTLKLLGVKTEAQGDGYVAIPPSWRGDLAIKEDIAEDVLRVNLFDAIEPRELIIPLKSAEQDEIFAFERRLEEILVSIGGQQTISYAFLSEEKSRTYKFTSEELVPIQNPDTSDQAYLLPSLLPPLIDAVVRNLSYLETPQLFFEIGRIFSPRKFNSRYAHELNSGDRSLYEQNTLGIIYGEDFSLPAMFSDDFRHKHPFFMLKGVLSLLMQRLGITNFKLARIFVPFLDEKLSFAVNIQANEKWELAGFLGEVCNEITNAERVEKKLAYLELSINALAAYAKDVVEVKSFSVFPPTLRDITLLLPAGMEIEKVLSAISESGGEFLLSAKPFDVYFGKQVPPGMKSVAVRLTFQASDRTLVGEEVDEILLDVLTKLYSQLGITLRDYEKVISQKVFSADRFSERLRKVYLGEKISK